MSGSISQLAPGATDASDMSVGLNTSSAGALSGAVTLSALSDLGGGNTSPIASQDPYIDVFGTVYRPAAFTVQPSGVSVHVGDAGTQSLIITNTDVNDGYSENLIATVIGTTGGVQAHGTTGDIAPQSTGSIGLTFSTAMAGLIGTVTLDLKSDGTGIDGLGQIDLGDVTVPVTVTSTNVAAAAQIEELSGGGTFTRHGSVYTLDLGTIDTAPGPINLGVLNTAVAPADTLGGSFSISGDPAFTNNGFGAFTGITSGSADTAPTVTLAPTVAGTYSETITLVPLDETGSGNAPLSNETLTITANYQPQLEGSISLASATEGTALPDTPRSPPSPTPTRTTRRAPSPPASTGVMAIPQTAPQRLERQFHRSAATPMPTRAASRCPSPSPIHPTTRCWRSAAAVAAAEADVFTPQGITFTTQPGKSFSGTVASFTDAECWRTPAAIFPPASTGATAARRIPASSPLSTAQFSSAGRTPTPIPAYDTVTVTLSDDAPGTASASAISTAKVVPQAPGPNPPVITAMVDLASSTEAKGTAQAGTTINLYDNGGGTAIATGIAANDEHLRHLHRRAGWRKAFTSSPRPATDGLNQTSSPSTPVTVIEQYIGPSNYSITTDINFTLAPDEHYLTFLGSRRSAAPAPAAQNVFAGNTGHNTFTGGPGDNDYFVRHSSDTIIATADMRRHQPGLCRRELHAARQRAGAGAVGLRQPDRDRQQPRQRHLQQHRRWIRSSAAAATTPSLSTTAATR